MLRSTGMTSWWWRQWTSNPAEQGWSMTPVRRSQGLAIVLGEWAKLFLGSRPGCPGEAGGSQ